MRCVKLSHDCLSTIAGPSRYFLLAAVLLLPFFFYPYPQAFSQPEQEHLVVIPRGGGNPTPDLTLQNVASWYVPGKLAVKQGDSVTWRNNDSEPHTVTSGTGGGIVSAHTREEGKPDGIFDSGFFDSGESWSFTFDSPGTYAYFCTIHPWMEGVVTVETFTRIPSYPVDAQGNEQDVWPVHTITKDGMYDIDLSWDPEVPLTGETVTFFADFFDARTNARLQLAPYDFTISQDGRELDSVHSLSQIGAGVQKYVFSKSGPITIRIAGIGDSQDSYSEFSTFIYPNPEGAGSTGGQDVERVEGGSPPVPRLINSLTLVYATYGIIFALPAAAAAVVILYKKGII